MKADVPLAEREALEWATNFFSFDARSLTRKGSAELLRELAEHTAICWLDAEITPLDKQDDLVPGMMRRALIDGDEFATMVLSYLALEHIHLKKPMSQNLQTFVYFRLLHPNMKVRQNSDGYSVSAFKRKSGPKADDWMYRDWQITHAIESIRYKWGFQATRNPASQSPSAASIVRDALEKGANQNLTEGAVNKVWNEKGKDYAAFLQEEGR